MIKYKIIEVNEELHTIIVRFYTEVVSEDLLAISRDTSGIITRCKTDYNLDVPVPVPTGDALSKFIMSAAPIAWLQAQEVLLDPLTDTSMSSLHALLGTPFDIARP